jgi:2-dehydro-3-deoxyphosphogluconate aldolase / (4S)-4-hydroxy-2-oxoglutarate aldolase
VSRDEALGTLLDTGVVAVVRTDSPRDLVRLARALVEGGVRLVEITMTVPAAVEVIEQAASALGADAVIGAGTVLDAATAERAVSAGAGFVVSPALDTEVIETAHRHGVVAIPGCLTPTEIALAWSAGADVVKLFPGRVATPGYFADVRGPFPDVRLMPTGNVDLETAPQYIRAGAVAVGVGKALVDPEALGSGDWATITGRARQFRRAVDEARARG